MWADGNNKPTNLTELLNGLELCENNRFTVLHLNGKEAVALRDGILKEIYSDEDCNKLLTKIRITDRK